jgi:hypothetical protein
MSKRKEFSKLFFMIFFLLLNTGNIYAHGDYTQLITNPFVFGASVATFLVFSFMISLINKYWVPPMLISHWKLGLSLIVISSIIYFVALSDHIIVLFFLLLTASILPAFHIVVNNKLTLKQKVIVVFLSTVTYFVSGGISGFLYLSSL